MVNSDSCCILPAGDKPRLEDVLKFATGLSTLPLMKNHYKIKLFYLPEEVMPEASACLYLPISHSSADSFNTKFDQAVLMSKDYFGLN